MPEQMTFLDERVGNKQVLVVKTYDEAFAHEAFDRMPEDSLRILSASLELDSKFNPEDIPGPEQEGFADAIWEEVKGNAREEWNRFSYFVVQEHDQTGTNLLFVSPDWPSAEQFARKRLNALSAR